MPMASFHIVVVAPLHCSFRPRWVAQPFMFGNTSGLANDGMFLKDLVLVPKALLYQYMPPNAPLPTFVEL